MNNFNYETYTRNYNRKNFGDFDAFKEIIKNQWQEFKDKNGTYPTSQEIDKSDNMIPTKTIQRRVGSLANMRKVLGLDFTNYSSGEIRSAVSATSMRRALDNEQELSAWLIQLFGDKPNVIIEERYLGHTRHRSDCGIYYKGKHFFVDIFSAKDKYSLSGCINFKQKKLGGISDSVFLVSSNPLISQEFIDSLVYNKKNKLQPNAKVLTLDNFKKFCLDTKSML